VATQISTDDGPLALAQTVKSTLESLATGECRRNDNFTSHYDNPHLIISKSLGENLDSDLKLIDDGQNDDEDVWELYMYLFVLIQTATGLSPIGQMPC
jgi:hypothetical protein